MIKVLFICHGTQVYDNAYLRRLGQYRAEYGGKTWNYYGFDY